MGVWIDTDMGFDDLAAVLIVAHQGLAIDGVSLSFGNAPLPQVEANAAGAAAAFRWRFPIHSGSAQPVLGRIETAQNVLGQSGMRTAGKTLPHVTPSFAANAFEALCRWLSADGLHRLLALGPLTNIAAVALARPELLARLDELVWMGGGLTSGNHTASAEFNAYADPEALAILLAREVKLVMVDLDVCRKVITTPADIEPVRGAGGGNAELVADLLAGYVAIGTSRGRPGHALYDPVAAAIFCRPEIATLKPARIDMELGAGLTRGRTVVDVRPTAAPNARYAAEIDVEAARRIILEALVAAAT